jgi:RNA-directed DNA polymerase
MSAWKSEQAVVPEKLGKPDSGDPVEGRASRKKELGERTMARTRTSESISTRVAKITQLARKHRDEALTPLSHYIDMAWMEEAHAQTRKDGATGIDNTTMADYEQELQTNLRSLLERAKSGTYRAPPVKRVFIPKADGAKVRPIGIPTVEDKILQRAVKMVLEPVYEQEFYDWSYGFRPRRSAHDALQRLREQAMTMGGGWILEADIEGFFDAVDHEQLRNILRRRVSDGVLVRLIGKWLKAGVLEAGRVSRPEAGTPQGGVISPLLANVYLHEVLDTWFANEVRPRLSGEAHLIRYADDFVIIFAKQVDAHRVMDVLPKRFGRYGLRLHPEKTRIVPFARPRDFPKSEPESFEFLSFRHYWAKSRRGFWVIKRKTSAKRMSRTLKVIGGWCRVNRHLPVREQHRALSAKLRGHDAYFGITGNSRALSTLRDWTRKIWRKWLGRRSNQRLTWEEFARILATYPLPNPFMNGR